MIRKSSRLINQFKQIDDKSIKILVNQFKKLNTSTNELSLESLAAKGCPFHQNKSSHLKQESSSLNKINLESSNESVNLVDKFKNLFKSKINLDEQLDYLRIPKTASFLPGLTSILRLTKNGGVQMLHKHCDKLHKEHGPIYREQLGPVEGVFIADDSLIKEVFNQEDVNPRHLIPEPWLIYNEIKKVQRGLFFLNGESWKKQRTCLNGLFLKKNALSNYMTYFTSIIDDMLTGWENSLDNKNCLIIPELEKQLYSWSIESLGTVIFGRRLGCIPEYRKMKENPNCNKQENFDKHHKISKMQEEFNESVRRIFFETGKLQLFPAKIAHKLNLPVWRRFVEANDKALEIAKNYVEENIKENDELKRNGIVRDGKGIGIVNELLQNSDLKGENLNSIVTDLFLAATDTTSHSTQWALYMIAKNPECQKKILEELDNVLEEGEELEEKHLKNLDYVRGVIKETLRLYPVAPFISRIFSKDINVGGYKIPKNKMVVFSLYTIGRMEKHYQDADKFIPERWIRNEERKKFVRKFKIEMANEGEEIDIRLRMITTPEQPISLKLTKRN